MKNKTKIKVSKKSNAKRIKADETSPKGIAIRRDLGKSLLPW